MSFQHIYNLALFWHFKILNLAPKSQLDLASLKNLYPVCIRDQWATPGGELARRMKTIADKEAEKGIHFNIVEMEDT